MEGFVALHESQLRALQIPEPLFPGLYRQLQTAYSPQGQLRWHKDAVDGLVHLTPDLVTDYGAILVIPHVCAAWDIQQEPSRGLLDALAGVATEELRILARGLAQAAPPDTAEDATTTTPSTTAAVDLSPDREALLNAICGPHTWRYVTLSRRPDGGSQAALLAPPYFPPVALRDETDDREADLAGPFPFVYQTPGGGPRIDLSLAYLSPGVDIRAGRLPTMDYVPAYSCPNPWTRAVRLCALLGAQAPLPCQRRIKEVYAQSVKQLHLARQAKLESRAAHGIEETSEAPVVEADAAGKVWKVFTDSNDPLELHHPEAGLSKDAYALVESVEEADIVFSYHSLYAPGGLRDKLQSMEHKPLVNQFPYEGAFVQKDHLARELRQQHGLPSPPWVLTAFDLDVQLAEFVGSHGSLKEQGNGEDPLWIVKPANLTQSRGHVVSRSLAQMLKLIDGGGVSRVAQRYIMEPICYDGRKVDCRCIVLLTDATPGHPTLYIHKRVYFRIANKRHSVETPADQMDNESFLTATHLLSPESRSTADELVTLPVDYKAIAKLEQDYDDFNWTQSVEPKIKALVKELFAGMTQAYPAMAEASNARAMYGIDVMFERDESTGEIEPRLTEVTFCPSSNAICDAYERDDDLFNNYNTDVFDCLFRGIVSENLTRL
jgi:hypothetical protein